MFTWVYGFTIFVSLIMWNPNRNNLGLLVVSHGNPTLFALQILWRRRAWEKRVQYRCDNTPSLQESFQQIKLLSLFSFQAIFEGVKRYSDRLINGKVGGRIHHFVVGKYEDWYYLCQPLKSIRQFEAAKLPSICATWCSSDSTNYWYPHIIKNIKAITLDWHCSLRPRKLCPVRLRVKNFPNNSIKCALSRLTNQELKVKTLTIAHVEDWPDGNLEMIRFNSITVR